VPPHADWRALLTWVDAAPCLVANRPSASEANASKPFQSRLIATAGFRVPDSLVTTDAGALRRFRRGDPAVIFKSMSGRRSIVTRMADEHGSLIENLRWCPTMFQRYVPGTEFRANVVGRRVFTARVDSDADDYRFGPRRGIPTTIVADELPSEIESRVVRMCAAMGLPVAGVDLRRTPEGAWYCFEVNPSPAFAYYEAATGQPLSAAVAGLLADADADATDPARATS
jgi:glutathione synthase/RimK-type ligase-like ATP-grasp enzyme